MFIKGISPCFWGTSLTLFEVTPTLFWRYLPVFWGYIPVFLKYLLSFFGVTSLCFWESLCVFWTPLLLFRTPSLTFFELYVIWVIVFENYLWYQDASPCVSNIIWYWTFFYDSLNLLYNLWFIKNEKSLGNTCPNKIWVAAFNSWRQIVSPNI